MRRDHLFYGTQPPPVLPRHYVETFFGAGSPATRHALGWKWGWQCFTCGREADGFDTLAEAETAGTAHTEAVAARLEQPVEDAS